MKVLLIDNYDSFTHNLAQQFWSIGVDLDVHRNDEISLHDALDEQYTHYVISPGPGHPKNTRDFGVCKDLLGALPESKPLLGVCLGHQGIALHFGAELAQAPKVMHGKTSLIQHDRSGIFRELPIPLKVMRYHSLCVPTHTLPSCLTPTAWSPSDGVLMGFKHVSRPVYGVQFHPESIETNQGLSLIKNFLNLEESMHVDLSRNEIYDETDISLSAV